MKKIRNNPIIKKICVCLTKLCALFIIQHLLILTLFASDTSITPITRYSKNEVVIGVVKSSVGTNFFIEGVQMAVDEINEKGGPLGKPIKILVYDDKDDVIIGKQIANKLVENKDVIAVIGHRESSVALTVSQIYQDAGIMFLCYGSKDPKLTMLNRNLTLRNIPTLKDYAREMAEYIQKIGIKKTVVFSERSLTQMLFADILKKEAVNRGIDIVASRSYFKETKNFKPVLLPLKQKFTFDYIVILGSLPSAGLLIKQLREIEINVPLMGGDLLDSQDVWVIAGKSSEDLTVPTIFNPEFPNQTIADFVNHFFFKYLFNPDSWAAQGYDAVSLIADAIERTSSTDPESISSELKFLQNREGVNGSYSFVTNGDITGKKIFFKEMSGGDFIFTEKIMDYESDLDNYIKDYSLLLPLEGSVTTIDPGLSSDVVATEVIDQLFLGLTCYQPETYAIAPLLATSWKVSDDGKIYVFYLRDDVTWTDGKPVTAHDIVWAIQRNINPETSAPNVSFLHILKNAKAINEGQSKDLASIGVSARDDYTVVFELEYPAVYFPAFTSIGIYRPLPKTAIEKFGENWTLTENIQSNGAYRLVFLNKDRGVFLKKSQTYWDAKNVTIPEVRYFVTPQTSLALGIYDSGWFDVMGSMFNRLPFGAAPRYKNDPDRKQEYFQTPKFCTYAYAFNTKMPPVDNPLVRQAISASIDRRLITEVITRGNEEPATTFTRPPAFGSVSPEDGIGIGFNPSQAKKWLAKAGYPDGKNFPEITIMYNESTIHEHIAKAIQMFLSHYLNINIKLEPKDWDGYVDALSGNPPHIFRAGFCADYPDADNFLRIFHPNEGMFKIGVESSEFTQLFDMGVRESNPEQRKLYYKRIEQILCDEYAAVIPIYYEVAHCLVQPRIKGWYHMGIGGQHISKWSFKKNW